MILSVVIPVFNEAKNLQLLMPAVDQAFAGIDDVALEIIFVDDGSTDDTINALRLLAGTDSRVRVICFSRNFGSHAALMAGFHHCTGDAVAFIAADLQDPPELLPRMVAEWRKGVEIVWGVREKRHDPLTTRLFSWLYSGLMRRLTPLKIPRSGLDVCLADRRVVQAVVGMDEKNTSIVGLIMWSGFRQSYLPYRRGGRRFGKSGWTLGKKVKMFVDSFVSFSFFPIRLVSYLGLSVSVLGFLYAFFLIFRRLVYQVPVQGWTSTMVAVVTLAGLQLVMLGVVAEYLWRTFDESRKRPSFIVRERIGFEDSPRTPPPVAADIARKAKVTAE